MVQLSKLLFFYYIDFEENEKFVKQLIHTTIFKTILIYPNLVFDKMSISGVGTAPSSAAAVPTTAGDNKELHALVLQLTIPEQRETALLELSKKRESFAELAPVLWHSYGTIAALLQVNF
jgi:hypothetical protein